VILPLLALAGCSRELKPPPTGYERLELKVVDGAIEYPELTLLGRWEDFRAGDHDGWSIRGAEPRVALYQEQPMLQLAREEDVIVEIPIDVRITRRCVLELLTVARGDNSLLTAAIVATDGLVGTEQIKVSAGSNIQAVVFQIGDKGLAPRQATKIILRIPKGPAPLRIRSLSLKQGALGMELGAPAFGGFHLVEIDGDARGATALPSQTALRAEFSVESPADVLRFGYAQPDFLRVAGQELVLRVSLRVGERQEEQVFSLGSDPEVAPGWQHAQLALGGWQGARVSATFRLDSSAGPAMCVLEQPDFCRPDARAPTVLLITSDTHRSDHLGFLMEDGGLRTDAIDRLAASGVVFLNALSSVNNTTPSHVSLFTGLSPRDTGIVANAKRLADEAPTLAEAFRGRGYATLASVSAAPVNYKICGLGQGFDRYSIPTPKPVRDSAETLSKVLEWLPDFEGAPLFLWVHIYDAHGPYEPPDELKRLYYPEDKDPFDPSAPGADIARSPYWDKSIADPDYTEALYKSEITYLDGRLAELFAIARIQDGIIAFTADHGEVLRYGSGEPFDHRGLSLNTLAIPMILKAPGLPAGERRQDPVMQIDLGRTLLDLAGLDDVAFPGRDILGQALEPGEPRFAMQANGLSASVLTDEWMFVLNLRVPDSEAERRAELYHSVELYDLRSDRFCQHDVWREHREKSASLRKLLVRWLERSENRHWEAGAIVPTQEIEQHLADLGYVSVEDSKASEWFDSECDCPWCREFE
jgi:arylsulfatase A-like enzyme